MHRIPQTLIVPFLMVLSLFPLALFSQTRASVDSLEAQLAHATVDSIRLQLLMRLGNETLPTYFKKSHKYAAEAFQLAQDLDDPLNQAVALYHSGMAISMDNRWAEALDTFQLSLDRLIALYQPARQATCLLKMGHCHKKLQQFAKAADYQLKAIRIRERLGDEAGVASAYVYLSATMTAMDRKDKAIDYARKAAEYFEGVEQTKQLLGAWSTLGNAYYENGQYDEANEQFEKLLTLKDQYDIPPFWAGIFLNYGMGLNDMGRPKEALPHLLLAYEQAEKISFLDGMVRSLLAIGTCYNNQQKGAQALSYLKKGLTMADSMHMELSTESGHYQLSIAYEQLNKGNLALQHYRSFSQIRDSVHRRNAENKAIEMEAAYDSERKERELALSNKELKLLEKDYQLTYLTLSAIVLFILLSAISLMFLWRHQKMRNEQEQRAHLAEMAKEKLERDALHKDMHFKNQQLASYALQLTQKSEQLAGLKASIAAIKRNANDSDSVSQQLDKIGRQIDQARLLDKDWDEFKYYFEQVHTDFFIKLKKQFSALTNNDLRLCAFLRLNLSTKEIANLLGQSPKSIEIARYRLRKKLNLEKGDRLIDFLLQMD